MHQIPLPVSISEYMTFETFHSSSNKVVIDSIKDNKNKLLWIAGLKGSGKTHILQATINYMDDGINRLLYLPMRESKDFTPDILDNLDQFDLVAIDDIENVIGDFSWEEQLLILYEELIFQNYITARALPRALCASEYSTCHARAYFSRI